MARSTDTVWKIEVGDRVREGGPAEDDGTVAETRVEAGRAAPEDDVPAVRS